MKAILGGHGQKRAWPVWSLDPKIDPKISRMNLWNELTFECWCKFKKAKRYFKSFRMGMVKMGVTI